MKTNIQKKNSGKLENKFIKIPKKSKNSEKKRIQKNSKKNLKILRSMKTKNFKKNFKKNLKIQKSLKTTLHELHKNEIRFK